MGPGAGLDAVAKRKVPSSVGNRIVVVQPEPVKSLLLLCFIAIFIRTLGLTHSRLILAVSCL